MTADPKVLIIGAGAAGIAAATRLLEGGLKNLVILEAKNRIGGRIHTVKYGIYFLIIVVDVNYYYYFFYCFV